MQFHLFFPQSGVTPDDVVARAGMAEAAGFEGVALIDHLAAPGGGTAGAWDAIVAASWIVENTLRLTVGHLVLCDAVRNPAVLAREVVALDHRSHGRFELGLGWGSDQAELDAFGFDRGAASDRAHRLRESIDVMRLLWTGRPVDFAGRFHSLRGALAHPTPTRRIPLIVGGAGTQILKLAATHADWWNCPALNVRHLAEYLPHVGPARVSIHQPVVITTRGANPDNTLRSFERLVGADAVIAGNVDRVVAAFRRLADLGVERAYVWSPGGDVAAFADVIDRF